MNPKPLLPSQLPSDEPPDNGDEEDGPSFSLSQTFFIVLILHVLAVGGILTYDLLRRGEGSRAVCDRIANRLGYVKPPGTLPAPILDALAARLAEMDARLNAIETDLARLRSPNTPPPPRPHPPSERASPKLPAKPPPTAIVPLGHPSAFPFPPPRT